MILKKRVPQISGFLINESDFIDFYNLLKVELRHTIRVVKMARMHIEICTSV
jgi:hypothetical protein